MKQSNSLPLLFHKKDTHHLKMHCEIVSLLIILSSGTCNRHVSYKIKMTTAYNTWFISKSIHTMNLQEILITKIRRFPYFLQGAFFDFPKAQLRKEERISNPIYYLY